MTEKLQNPFKPPNLFWDVEISEIDWEENAKFVINRVLMRGGLKDWYGLKEIYGLERIKEASLSARYLDKYTLSFCSVSTKNYLIDIIYFSINLFKILIFRHLTIIDYYQTKPSLYLYFNVPKEKFRCYDTKQSIQKHWNG